MPPALAVALVTAAAVPAGPAASAEELVRAATRDFVLAWNARDVDRLLAFYADDYLDLNLRQPRQSREQRRLYLAKILARGDTRLEVAPDEVVVSGAYAIARGSIRLLRSLPGGGTHVEELRYMELLRQSSGGWKAVWGLDAEIYPDSRQ